MIICTMRLGRAVRTVQGEVMSAPIFIRISEDCYHNSREITRIVRISEDGGATGYHEIIVEYTDGEYVIPHSEQTWKYLTTVLNLIQKRDET